MTRAFSLIELVIVVVIIAVIAAIAIPRATQASRNATAATMAAHIRKLVDIMEMYHAEHGDWPADSDRGVRPPVLADLLRQGDFGPTPAGGEYDWQNWINKHGFRGCIMGISGQIHDWDLIERVDHLLDDGDLASGRFVRYFKKPTVGTGQWAGYVVFTK